MPHPLDRSSLHIKQANVYKNIRKALLFLCNPLIFLYFQEPRKLNCRNLIEFERKLHYCISRTMAAISLCFIILITPWTFKEVIEACTGTKVSYYMPSAIITYFETQCLHLEDNFEDSNVM